MLAKGTLVRVKESAITKGAEHYAANLRLVADRGTLFIIDRWNAEEDGYYTRSLASGDAGVFWFSEEIETYEE